MVKYMNNQSPRTKRKNEGIKGSVFTFFSTASAVGKTVLAVNYAADLAERGYKVCLADLDLQFGDACNYLGITPETTFFNYYEQDDDKRGRTATADKGVSLCRQSCRKSGGNTAVYLSQI